MTLQQLKDERVEQAKSKIYSELMLIIFYIVVASFCVKALYFHMDLKQCATEYIILILTPIYQAIRSRQTEVVLGTGQDSRKRATPLLLLLLIPFFLRKSEWTNGDFSALLPPVVFVLLFLAIQYLFSHAEKKRAENLEKRYDAEDETK